MRNFVNLTEHELTAEQVQAAKELGVTRFLEAADILPPDTLEKLRNCPSDYKELTAIVYEIIGVLKQMSYEDKPPFVHLPCSSPALIWLLSANNNTADIYDGGYFLIPVFSHSVKGVFEKFIVI